jgi:UDP-N-acetyl-2-amino-2-deoxyglucuronate dehydrogenase
MTDETRLKIAFIGCGGIAQAHWRGIQNVAHRLDVTAAVDTVPDAAHAMAAQTGATAFTDLATALAEGDFDAVDIMLPHDMHEAATAACFDAGKHVLLEKPMSNTLESCERILAAADKVNTIFMIAEQAQYWTDITKARQLMDEGAIGEVLNASGNFYDRVTLDPDAPIPWRFDIERSGGGLSIDGGAHWIRPLRMMMGEIEEVIAVTGRHVPQMQGESWAQALFRFKSGTSAAFTALNVTTAAAPVEMFRISGTEGELLITGGRNGELVLYNGDHPRGHAVMDATQGKMNSYGEELKDFTEVVLDGTSPAASPAFSLGEFRTAQAMYRSVESKCWEKVWDNANE